MDITTTNEPKIIFKKGSKQRLVPWADRHVGELPGIENITIVLCRIGVEEGERSVMARWPSDRVVKRPGEWADEVLDLVRDRTETANCKCEYLLQALGPDGTVQRDYVMTAQPMMENLSPTPEGVLQQAMRERSQLVGTMLSDRSAVIESYQGLISQMRQELERATRTIARYQEREEQYHTRELELVDRERKLRMAEVEGAADSKERTEDRYDRVLDKAGEVVEAAVVEAVSKLVEGIDAKDVPALLKELGPIAAKFLGGTNGSN